MKRALFMALGIIALTLIAAGLTEATLAMGHRGDLTKDPVVHTTVSPTPTATPSVTPPTVAPTPTPSATPTPTPVVPTATTNGFVHLRAGASTATAIVTDLNGGTTVTLGAYSDSQWQEVYYNGLHGYIFKSYLAY